MCIRDRYKTHWVGLSEPSWEREMDLHLSRSHILRCWAGTPDQHRQTKRLYRRMWIGAAQPELSRNNDERFLAPGHACARNGSTATTVRCCPREPTFGTRATMGCGGVEKSVRVRRRMEYTWPEFWTTRGRSSSLFRRRATQPQRGPCEVLGARTSTKPARSLGGFNVM